MNKVNITYYLLFIGLLFLTTTFVGCKDDLVTQPRNYFEGVMDGVPFMNTKISAYKDTSDIFTIVGRTGGNENLFLFFHGKDESEYNVTQGTLFQVSQLADQSLTNFENFQDTIQALINQGQNNLPEGECFALLISGGRFYYSNRGSVTLTAFDGSINRINGLMDIELVNITDGPTYVQAFYDDVYYTDCPSVGICILDF